MNVKKIIFFLTQNGTSPAGITNSKIYTGFSPFNPYRYFLLNSLTNKEKGIILTKQKQNG